MTTSTCSYFMFGDDLTYWTASHRPVSPEYESQQQFIGDDDYTVLQQLIMYDMSPMQRGPSYRAYTELREWKLREKATLCAALLATPMPRSPLAPSHAVLSSVLTATATRKENKKPPYNVLPAGPKLNSAAKLKLSTKVERPVMTPRPVVRGEIPVMTPRPGTKAELLKFGSITASRGEEKRGGGTPAMRKSFSCVRR